MDLSTVAGGSVSSDSVSDAAIYLTTLKLLTEGADVQNEFRHLRSLIARYDLYYTTLEHLLQLVLVYTTPVSRSVAGITELVAILTGDVTVENDYDVDEFANWITNVIDNEKEPWVPQHAIIPSATDLLHQTNSEAQKYGTVTYFNDPLETKFSFVKAKFVQVSPYINEILDYTPLIKFCEGYQPFLYWYNGLIKPYFFYWNNLGAASNDPMVLADFLAGSYEQKFFLLVSPITHKTHLNLWTSNVILPIVTYHNKDFNVMNEWMFTSNGKVSLRSRTIAEKFHFWNIIIKAIIHDFKHDDYAEVIRYYLASCYFYSFADLSSIETLKIYDSIIETLQAINGSMNESDISIQSITFDDINTESFSTFFTPSNPLYSWFEPSSSSVSNLLQITTNCQKLFPTTKLTIANYLSLKHSSDLRSKEREVSKITSTLSSANYSTLLTSSLQFMDTFITEEESSLISKLLVERFLQADLFDVVGQFYENSQFSLSVDDYFDLVLEKFWLSYNSANNLNDKIGRLHEAAQCVRLFDILSNDLDFHESQRNQVVKIKHLLKAIANMKNFRIVIQQNQPFTPSQILKFRPNDEISPLKLITVILELNAKSYLAFEKLYKILNDLLMFFEDDSTETVTISPTYYFNKLKSACIESALIDNNFQYAYTLSKELFEYYRNDSDGDSNVNDIWLTLYQVGKYVSPAWFDAPDANMYDVLLCQREILSLTLQYIQPATTSRDNSRVVLKQWQHINQQLEQHFSEDLVKDIQYFDESMKIDRTEQLGAIANEIINDATATTNQASEKLSNLFVLGLGWAIGARNINK